MILKFRAKQRKLNLRPTLRLFPLQEFQSPTVLLYSHQERGVVFKLRYLEPSKMQPGDFLFRKIEKTHFETKHENRSKT